LFNVSKISDLLDNQPPQNAVPSSKQPMKNTSTHLQQWQRNRISISDPDAGENPVQVTLSAANGTLTYPALLVNLQHWRWHEWHNHDLFGHNPDYQYCLNGLVFMPPLNFRRLPRLSPL